MPINDPALALLDILDSVNSIAEFTFGLTLETFERDAKTEAAVERKLQIVSEAAIRLGDDADLLCPGLNWRNIRGFGNWLRHEYHRVDAFTIWKTVVEELPPLKASVLKALDDLSGALQTPQNPST